MTRTCKNLCYSRNCEHRSEEKIDTALMPQYIESLVQPRRGYKEFSGNPGCRCSAGMFLMSVYIDAELARQMFSKNSKHSWSRYLLPEGLSRL